ncbi:uncharacterized protein LOC131957618 [Physella acuta]|uniref:uncharacterized protein LOC131957618 n=1 Tax=Physella acuta TaxID=109671 RepID=UPI0027DB817D|nr:uncharacterized protein LOC131957618 [Physella acuta]
MSDQLKKHLTTQLGLLDQMSAQLKKHLTTQLELLDESSFHLQSSISDFIQQIRTRANECVDNMPGSSKAVKDAIAMVTTAQSIILEHTDIFNDSTKLSPTTVMTLEKTTPDIQDKKAPISVEYNPETSRRLKDIETVLSSLQNATQKTEDDISEIKQWRDNFVTEQSDLGIKIQNWSKKQKQNYKNLRKQLIEQDDKIEQLIQQIHVVTFKLLQQRLMPIDKIIERYNQKYETREGKMKKTETLEKEVLKLSQDLQSIANQQVKPSTPGFIASQGRSKGKFNDGYQVITFSAVETNVGNHFDPKTGEFTVPVDGL